MKLFALLFVILMLNISPSCASYISKEHARWDDSKSTRIFYGQSSPLSCEGLCDEYPECIAFMRDFAYNCSLYSEPHPDTLEGGIGEFVYIQEDLFDTSPLDGLAVAFKTEGTKHMLYLCAGFNPEEERCAPNANRPKETCVYDFNTMSLPSDESLASHPECRWIVHSLSETTAHLENAKYRGWYLIRSSLSTRDVQMVQSNKPEYYPDATWTFNTVDFEADPSGELFSGIVKLLVSDPEEAILVDRDTFRMNIDIESGFLNQFGAKWHVIVPKFLDGYQLISSMENQSGAQVDMSFTLTVGVSSASTLGQSGSSSSTSSESSSVSVEVTQTTSAFGGSISSSVGYGHAWGKSLEHASDWESTSTESFSKEVKVIVTVPIPPYTKASIFQLVGLFDTQFARSPKYFVNMETI